MDANDEIQQFKQQCLDYLNQVLKQIETFGEDVYLLDDEHLAALNVRKAQTLDIDEESVDFGRRFFSPRFTLEEARKRTTAFITDEDEWARADWRKRCRRGSFTELWDGPEGTHDPEETHPLCTPEHCSHLRMKWCLAAMGTWHGYSSNSVNFGISHGSDWYCVDDNDLVPDYRLNLPNHYSWDSHVMNPPRRYTFAGRTALLHHDPSANKAHIGAMVMDSTESGEGEVLRSEVAVAVGLLKYQIQRGDFLQHHTLPSIVFSFQHDRFGRISQFHFDGRSLVMRQSRLLDFRSDEPTTDAYHMLRWLELRPIGDTLFSATAIDEQDQLEMQNDRDTNGGKLPIDVRGA